VLERAPRARIDVVEKSAEMIALARRRAGDSGRVRFLCQDALIDGWPGTEYDAVLTLFFLDCFGEEEARQLIQRLERGLSPEGIWLVSEFAIPEKGWQRWHATLWVGTMYRFFRLTTGLRTKSLPPIERLLYEAGMRRIGLERTRAGLLVSEVLKRGADTRVCRAGTHPGA